MASKVKAELERQVNTLLRKVMTGEQPNPDVVELQLKVIDRALKLEALKIKSEDSDEGVEFDD